MCEDLRGNSHEKEEGGPASIGGCRRDIDWKGVKWPNCSHRRLSEHIRLHQLHIPSHCYRVYTLLDDSIS